MSVPSHSEPRWFPANLDAECAVLGGCLADEGVLHAVLAEGLTPDQFSVTDHQRVWEVILHMCDKGLPVTLISVHDFDLTLSPAALADLTCGGVLLESHIVHYARIVKRLARLRALMHLGEQLAEGAGTAGADPDRLASELILQISKLVPHER